MIRIGPDLFFTSTDAPLPLPDNHRFRVERIFGPLLDHDAQVRQDPSDNSVNPLQRSTPAGVGA